MPISLGPILVLAGVGIAAAKARKARFAKPTIRTAGQFDLFIEWPKEKQAEFAYGIMKRLPTGKMQTGEVTLDIDDHLYNVGLVEIRGSFTSHRKISRTFAYFQIMETLERTLKEFSVYPIVALNLYNLHGGLPTIHQWELAIINHCNSNLIELRNTDAFPIIISGLIAHLKEIAYDKKRPILDYDLVSKSLELINEALPGCGFQELVEEDLMGTANYSLMISKGLGIVSDDAYGTFALLIQEGYEWVEKEDVLYGFEGSSPSESNDFIEKQMSHYRAPGLVQIIT